MTKELLFSVTAKDCRFDYFKGTGKGGQKRNKTASGVRCTHIDSGAVGVSDDTRSQHENKVIAFRRMAETDKFKAWHKIECCKATGALAEAESRVERLMHPSKMNVEVFNGQKWVPFTDTI
jgi:protein subunit release factor A